MNRDVIMSIRLKPHERQLLNELASIHGERVTVFIRQVLNEKIKEFTTNFKNKTDESK